MKIIGMVLCLGIVISTQVKADEPVVRIQLGSDYNNYSVEELKRRVFELERAVWQLQQKVYQIQNAPTVVVNTPKPWTCLIQTPFNKTYTFTAGSRGESFAHVLKDCTTDNDTMFCKEDAVKCSQ